MINHPVKMRCLIFLAVLIFAFSAFGGALASAEEPAPDELLIVSTNQYFLDIFSKKEELLADCPARLVDAGIPNGDVQSWYAEEVSQGSRDFDICIASTIGLDIQSLIRHGMVAPLTCQTLKHNVQLMDFGGIDEYLSNPWGVLCAYPVDLWVDINAIHPETQEDERLLHAHDSFGRYLDTLNAWYNTDGFAQQKEGFHLLVKENADSDSIRYYLTNTLCSSYVHTYLHSVLPEGQRVRFDTPAFQRALEKILPLTAQRETDQKDKPALFDSPIAFWMAEEGDRFISDIPFFADAHEPYIHATPVLAIVNPNSNKVDEAMAFLRRYTELMEPLERFTLFPFDRYEGSDPAVLRQEQAYRDCALNFCVDCKRYWYILIWKADIHKTLQPYFDGQMTVEEVTRTLDDLVAKAYEELR